MSANKYEHHLLVIPEDEANRQIMTGFNTHLDVNSHRIQVEPVAGGWLEALEKFKHNHVPGMIRYEKRHVMILIDFDNRIDRIDQAKEYIPENLKERVFILGCLSELRGATGMGKEALGEALADACIGGNEELWDNEILAHNRAEMERMKNSICRHLCR
jgi:hypothetical protein